MSKSIFLENDKKKNNKSKIKKIIFLVFIIFLILGAYIYISASMVKTIEVEKHTTYSEIPIDVVFLRQESNITAPIGGQLILRDIGEIERVRVDQIIADIIPNNSENKENIVSVRTASAGVLSYKTDGLEENFTSGKLSEYNLEDIIGLEKEPKYKQKEITEGQVAQGDILFKVINNLKDVNLILYFNVSNLLEHNLDPVEFKKNAVWILEGDVFCGIILTDFKTWQDNVFYFARVIDNKELFFEHRKKRTVLVFDKKEGVLVPDTALVFIEEKPGLYLKQNADYRWEEVEILNSMGDNSLVNFDFGEDSIVINPWVLQ